MHRAWLHFGQLSFPPWKEVSTPSNSRHWQQVLLTRCRTFLYTNSWPPGFPGLLRTTFSLGLKFQSGTIIAFAVRSLRIWSLCSRLANFSASDRLGG